MSDGHRWFGSCGWKAILWLGCGTLVACRLSPVAVAEAEEFKIGYVDVAEVFDNYERTKASDAILEKKGKQKETELEGRMNDLKKLRQNLELLNNEAREAKVREIEEKSDELQRFRQSTARDLARERDKIAKDILAEIRQGLNEYAKAHGFALILDSRTLLYSQSGYDLTKEVIQLLNDRASAPRPNAAR